MLGKGKKMLCLSKVFRLVEEKEMTGDRVTEEETKLVTYVRIRIRIRIRGPLGSPEIPVSTPL